MSKEYKAFRLWVRCFKVVDKNGCWTLRKIRRTKTVKKGTMTYPPGFKTGKKLQYKIEGRYVVAHRVWFYATEESREVLGRPNATVSHRCHNEHCLNPDHLVVEPLQVNQSRNTCTGVCLHRPKCIRDGNQADKTKFAAYFVNN
nr:putative endonuclease [Naegleria sp. NG874]